MALESLVSTESQFWGLSWFEIASMCIQHCVMACYCNITSTGSRHGYFGEAPDPEVARSFFGGQVQQPIPSLDGDVDGYCETVPHLIIFLTLETRNF